MAWKDGFVIEYANNGKRVSCSKCLHYVEDDRSCMATGYIMTQNGYGYWRQCPKFALNPLFDSPENRRAEINHHYSHGLITTEEKEERLQAISRDEKARKRGPSETAGKGRTRNRPGPAKAGIKSGDRVMHPAHGKGRIVYIRDSCAKVRFEDGVTLAITISEARRYLL